ncbi:MAG: DNA ligase [Burkholderiales bacterium]|nr:DNA ligase [Burkholderiales bacterium]MDE2395096.1 DNA ligase [Burkholderiales bacterium]
METTFAGGATRRRFLGWLGLAVLAPGGGEARPDAMPLMLASTAPGTPDPVGFLVSEKYDGVRAHWDGRRLRFRSGAEVAAPASFVGRLPAQALDGELWLGRGRFEALSGIVRKAQPNETEWRGLRYMVFDLPAAPGTFAERARRIEALAAAHGWSQLVAVAQRRVQDRAALEKRLDEVVRDGGEGLVLHRAEALWQRGRSADLVKLKPLADAEALVIGQHAGRGRHAGRMGALRVRNEEGVEFLIGTGFSDAERENPPPAGSVVTYTYRGTTARGVPRFASFLRRREAE